MKKLFLFLVFFLFCIMICYAADVAIDPNSPGYDEYKRNQVYIPHDEPIVRDLPILYTKQSRDGLLIPLDETFTQILAGTDDGYSSLISLPFIFNFYSINQTGFYVNNNGNVSLGTPYSAYTAYGFPINSYPMLAPFWADVDTRPDGSGKVWMRASAHQVVVIWDHVGYFNSQVDKLNTFEVIFTDGTDPIIGIGNNVAFSYGDMQWTTGSFSGGVNGFGGTPATAGINKGDGSTFAMIGRFDHEGVDYDGPGGNADGVSYLDNQLLIFTIAVGNNIAPVLNGVPEPIELSIGDSTNFTVTAIGPEVGQTVYATVSSDLPSGFSYIVAAGNPCNISIQAQGLVTNVGNYSINISTFDNGVPVLTTNAGINVVVHNAIPVINSAPILQTLEDELYQYVLVVSDPDFAYGDAIGNVEFLQSPTGMTYNPLTQAIEWIPDNSNVGVHNVSFRLWDTLGGSTTQIYSLEVINVNDPPTIELPATLSFVKGDPLIMDIAPYISDVDNSELTISAVSGAHIQVSVDSLHATFSCIDWTGTENISFSVSDGVDRLIATDIIAVSVLAPHSCYDIQYTTNSNGNSPYTGTKVTVEGVVTGSGYTDGKFFIGDQAGGAWSGLLINSTQTVTLGDRVLVTGYVQESYNFTSLGSITSFYTLSTGEMLPSPAVIIPTSVSEAYESVLCRLENVIANSVPNTSQIFSVKDATGTALVDDGFFGSSHTWSNIAYGQLWTSLTGIVDYHTSAYHLNPRTDLEMIYSPAKTCYEVQYSTLTDYASPYVGQVVQVNAVVTAKNLARGLYWLGDPAGGAWSGLMVHDWGHTVAVGDNVLVTGTVVEYGGQTELDLISNVIILSNGNAVPSPTLLLPGEIEGLVAEQFEGVLIKIEQVSVSQAPDVNQEFIVSGQSGSVRIDDRLYPLQHTWQNMDIGRDWRSISGILDYINLSYRIIPRDDNDLVELNEFVVAVNYSDRNIQIIDTRDNASFGPYLTGQLGSNECIAAAMSPKNNVLLISDFNGHLIYHINMNNPFNPILETSYSMTFAPEDICFSQDGRFALVSDGGSITMVAVLNLETRTTVNTIDIAPNCAQGISIGPDGKVLINDTTNSQVLQYKLDLNTGSLTNTGIIISGITTCVNTAIHPSGKHAVVNSKNTNCKVFRLNDDDTITELQTLQEFVGSQSAIYSFDGSKVFFLNSNASPDQLIEYNVMADGTLTYVYQYSLSTDSASAFFGVDPITTNLDGSRVFTANSGDVNTPYVDVINTVNHSQTTVSAPSPVSLEIGNLTLHAMFTVRQTEIRVGSAAKFIQYSTGAPETFLWNFGDGATSTERHPQHSYAAAGTYSVSLTVTNGSRTNTITNTNLISVQASPNISLSTSNISAVILGEGITQESFTISNTGDISAQFQISDMSRSGLQPRIVDCSVRSQTLPNTKAISSTQSDRADDYSNWLGSNQSQNREVDWLSEAPSTGTIAPGASVEIVVTFNSAGLEDGIYTASIGISSNDIFHPVQYVNATLAVSVVNFTTQDNENNALEGVPDYDLDVYMADTAENHPVEFNIFVTETNITDAQLSILAWDVDETDGELDHVYINGHFAGALTGANEQWSTTVFVLNSTWVNPGPFGVNLIQIYVNVGQATWMTTIDWGQLILNQQTQHATIRNITLADSVFTTGMNIGITQEIDTDLVSQAIRIETNILDPDGINVAGASAVYTIHGTSDDAVSIQRAIPAGTHYGTYQVQTIVYDNISNIQQDIILSDFQVIQPNPLMSYDPPNLDFGTVMVTDSLMLEIDFYNSGYDNLNISQFSMTNAAFHLSSANVVVPHHETRTLQITYVPTVTENFNGSLTITSNNSTGATNTIPITAHGMLYPVPLTSITSPEQIDHELLNRWQIIAEVSFTDTMIVDATTLQYRYDRNGNGVYDASDAWTAIPGYSNATSINVQQAISWRLDGEHLAFEFRAQNMRHSGWSYTGTTQTMGISDDYYVRLDATPPQWIESFEVTGTAGNTVTLAWSPSADTHFDSYEIYYGTSEGVSDTDFKWDNIHDPALANIATTSTTITGLNPNATYYFVIRGRDIVNNAGDFSDEVSAMTGQANNVQNLHIEQNSGGVLLTWSALPNASQYTIYHSQYPDGPWEILSATPDLSLPISTVQTCEFFYVTGEILPAKSGSKN